MDKRQYLDAIRRESDATVVAAQRGLDVPVASCPGWLLGTLIGHLGDVFGGRARIVRSRSTVEIHREPEDDASYPGIAAWFESELDAAAMPPNVLPWFGEMAAELVSALEGVAPEEPMWTWFPPDQTAGFWMRRMACEAAVHRWDAEAAHGMQRPIDGELAREGIDEMFDVMVPSAKYWSNPRVGEGETYHFHCTDGPGEWSLTFTPEAVEVQHEHCKAAVAIRASASDLLLFLWGRVPADELDVLGDAALVDRYFELVPPG